MRAERAQRWLMRGGAALAIVAVLAVLGTAAWQGWRWHEHRQAAAAATFYFAATRQADQPGATSAQHLQAAASFQRAAETAPAGFRALSRLRAAALRSDTGERDAALELWDQVASDGHADPLLRDLASLLWVQHQIDSADPVILTARLKPLLAARNPWHALAQEQSALLDLRMNRTDQARQVLQVLANDDNAPNGVRGRANMLLAGLGGS